MARRRPLWSRAVCCSRTRPIAHLRSNMLQIRLARRALVLAALGAIMLPPTGVNLRCRFGLRRTRFPLPMWMARGSRWLARGQQRVMNKVSKMGGAGNQGRTGRLPHRRPPEPQVWRKQPLLARAPPLPPSYLQSRGALLPRRRHLVHQPLRRLRDP